MSVSLVHNRCFNFSRSVGLLDYQWTEDAAVVDALVQCLERRIRGPCSTASCTTRPGKAISRLLSYTAMTNCSCIASTGI